MEQKHRRILMNRQLLIEAKKGHERHFARLVGLHEEREEEITIEAANGGMARDEPDFFLGVTYTGNTLLHLAAKSNFLDVAEKIWRRERSLLLIQNKVLDTPLHFAARNGNHDMVSRFIGFAKEMGPDVTREVLWARNKDGETALHEAARHNHADVARLLITEDPGVASKVDDQGISPLYLATMSGYQDVVHQMVEGFSGIEVSKAYYAGPDGQTVVHAAVLRSLEITEELLRWNPLLAGMPDKNGSTPLHFAASFGYDKIAHFLLKYDYSLAYLYDSGGSFPVHVAAKTGHVKVIREITNCCADSDELLDNEGRNFLHVAAQEGRFSVVQLLCRTISKLKSMKNARDNNGNTPLHLAIDSGHDLIVRQLMQDKEVSLNVSNKRGLTPRDQSATGILYGNAITPISPKFNFGVKKSMELVGAYYGSQRWDLQLVDDHKTKEDAEKENEKVTSAIQTIGLGSVLIATATFAAAFTMPGGYRADDHDKAGSPTLADKYAFKAFIVTDTVAFLFSFHSTIILLVRGVTSSKPHFKKRFVARALWFIIMAARCTVVSFALAIYVVLSPVNKLLGSFAIVGGIIVYYGGMGRDYKLIRRVTSGRRGWKQLYQNKLPEATLRSGLSARFGYELSRLWYEVELFFPWVLAAVGPPLIELAVSPLIDLVWVSFNKLFAPNI